MAEERPASETTSRRRWPTGHVAEILRVLCPTGSGKVFLAGSVASAAKAGAQLTIPLILGSIVDDALLRQDLQALRSRTAVLVLLAVVTFVAHLGHQLAFTSLGEKGLAALQRRLLAGVHTLPKQILDGWRFSEIHALFTEDAPRLAALPGATLGRMVLIVIQMGGLIVLLSWNYGSQAFLVAALVPLYVLVPVLFASRTRRTARRLRDASAGVAARIQDLLRSTREIRIFGREAWARRSLEPLFEARRRHALGLEIVRSLHWLNYTLTFLVGALVYWYGGLLVFEGRLSVGELITLVALLSYLESPVQAAVSVSSEIQAMRASADRLLPILSAPREPSGGWRKLSRRRAPSIEFRGVDFRYEKNGAPALHDVTFSVPPGGRVGMVGPSGSGKSTMVALLLRLYEVERGSIVVNGEDIREYDLESLRSAIGFVPQDPLLLPGTLWDNLSFGNARANEAEVRASCRAASIHDFVESLSDGYRTEIGDQGVKLSGGQRQRLAIARAILRQPVLLVLDEATAALDGEVERQVLSNLEDYGSATTFIVTHRVHAVESCSLILVLDQGRLVACGRHEELMQSSSLYQRLREGPGEAMRSERIE